jgi:hypothetical protein
MDAHNGLVLDLANVRSDIMQTSARVVARRVYGKMDINLTVVAEKITPAKRTEECGNNLALPDIPDALVEKFIRELGDGTPGLEPLQIDLF